MRAPSPRGKKRKWGRRSLLPGVILALLFLSSCWSGNTPQVVKIGLIAPFEGPSRPLGYSVLYAVRLRLNEWNESGKTPRVELVALNDDSDPELAAFLPRQLAADPDVLVVLGPPQGHTARAALPALAATQLPTISLAPIRDDPPANVLPFAGVDSQLESILAPYVGRAALAWKTPLAGPVIWIGDPLTLAELLKEQPGLIAAAGSVAAEDAFDAWAGESTTSLLWAMAAGDGLPEHFEDAYQELAGAPSKPIARLAYLATDRVLQLLSATTDRQALIAALAELPRLALQLYRWQPQQCCTPLP